MKGIIGRPGDWTSAEEVQRNANRNPQRHDSRAARGAWDLQRWSHGDRTARSFPPTPLILGYIARPNIVDQIEEWLMPRDTSATLFLKMCRV